MDLFQYLWSLFSFILTPIFGPIYGQPHIVVIIADDMGWNDVGFHGSNEIPTPNIDALAYGGVILNRHYALPTCTPSRTAFLTGRHPIRMGLQGIPMNVAEPRGVPLHERLLPEYLRELGYVTRLVGKWHLGYYTDKHTPTRRGFDSFVGYYGGVITYFNHTVTKDKHTGIDYHWDTSGKIEPFDNDQYVTDFISDQAEAVIKNHDRKKPLFLQLAHVAAHASENRDPIEVRNMTEVNDTLSYIPDINRRKYAGVVTAMDDSVGRVVKALKDANMLSNSIIIFMSDNGSPTAEAPYTNYGSNYPLRGIKATVFEGGVRVPACVFSPRLKDRFRVSDELFHITDWFPTLYKLAGGDLSKIQDLDGVDQWSSISGSQKSNRESLLVNIDEVSNPEAAISGYYKLIRGINRYDDYYGKDGNDYSPKTYDVTGVLSSLAGRAIASLGNQYLPPQKRITELRNKATLRCEKKDDRPSCRDTCLFDIVKDPCETTNIIDEHPEMEIVLNTYIQGYKAVLMNQTNTYIDPAGYPENFNGYWMPWMDHEYTPPKNRNKSAIWSPSVFCEGWPIDDPRSCL
ncbi:arylsulfatase B [Nasonia vitripennis]|uniref:Sulfatase N-terminal domain-containing protein n=1 Tax=Nasonia vitripennis TaxID=7425 RepID=A0A7M7HHE1_NASVI|nr:arylsulfatase B [Nasonia vitripennis]